VLCYDPTKTYGVRTITDHSLREQGRRPAHEIQSVVVDPLGRCAIAHVYEGEVHVFPLGPEEAKGKGRRKSVAAADTSSEQATLENIDLSRGWTSRSVSFSIGSLWAY
jgi:hypothetical protein